AVIVPPPPPPPRAQELAVKEIKADHVRAHTIYANEIKADDVRGRIHHVAKMDTHRWRGELKGGSVSAAVIRAKEIKARVVIADTIYVHNLKMK
ncbi:MAG: hypothetical protein ACE147_04185, partial [Candidatus Methylomirabilales bacterium]